MLDGPARSPQTADLKREAPEAWVRCRVCAAEVAKTSARTEVGPSDLHTFVNPEGEVFELVCFTRAPGARASGEPSLRFSWFPGHAWRFAHCRSCGFQLGWRFEGPSQFWGLMRRALTWP